MAKWLPGLLLPSAAFLMFDTIKRPSRHFNCISSGFYYESYVVKILFLEYSIPEVFESLTRLWNAHKFKMVGAISPKNTHLLFLYAPPYPLKNKSELDLWCAVLAVPVRIYHSIRNFLIGNDY